MSMTFPALAAVQAELKSIFSAAGNDYDLSRVTIKGCQNNADKLAHIKALNDRRDELLGVASAADETGYTENGTAFGDPGRSYSGAYGQARKSIDLAAKSGLLPDYAAERATELVESGPDRDRTLAARWATAAGDPDYLKAFMRLVADPKKGHLLWTAKERDAYQAVAAVHADLKAMSTSAGAGGEMIPLTLDPAIMLTNAGSINPLRRISRTVRTVSNTWQGVTSAGATAEWKAESAQSADGSPVLAEAPIAVHMGDVDVPYSYEVEQDAMNFASELQKVLNDAADLLQATAFTTGTGTGQPFGVVTGATVVNNAAGAFVAADVYTLQNSLPARFSGNAQWCANIAVINKISEFETTAGNLKFPEIRQDRLLRKPMNELSDMSGDFSTLNSKFLLYGNFQAGFVIVDRIGSTLEILPGFGANQRPTGQRHAFLTFRTGSKVVVPAAIRVLNKTA